MSGASPTLPTLVTFLIHFLMINNFVAPGDLTTHLDCVIISHFHLDHCGALPFMTEMVGYSGDIWKYSN